MSRLYEPSPRSMHYACAVEDCVFIGSGDSDQVIRKETLEVYNSLTETWTQKKTTGQWHRPEPIDNGTSAIASCGKFCYLFGGEYEIKGAGRKFSSDLFCLDTTTFKRTQLPLESPKEKSFCGMVYFEKNKLVLFGGYGPLPNEALQQGSSFVENPRFGGGTGWNNELHVIDLDTGMLQ